MIKLSRLFASRPDDVLRTLQSRGVIKLGEFKEKSNLVYPAFKSSSILTTGASERFIDYEQLWRQELRQRAGPGVPGGWSADVVVEAFVVNVADAADPDKDGIIQPLLKRWQAGGCSLATFGLPALQAVISFKWRAFARRLLLCQLGFFMVWIASFVTFTALFQDENLSLTLGQLMATRRGAATVAAELVALLAMTPFLVLEYGTLCAYGVSGWFSVWNGLDLITYTIQISVSAMHLCRWKLKSDALSNLLALQCIFLLFRLQYYSRVFRSTRFAFLEAIRSVALYMPVVYLQLASSYCFMT